MGKQVPCTHLGWRKDAEWARVRQRGKNGGRMTEGMGRRRHCRDDFLLSLPHPLSSSFPPFLLGFALLVGVCVFNYHACSPDLLIS